MALLLVAVKRLVDEHLGELPVSAVGLQSQEPDVGEVDDVFAVDPNKAEGFEQRCDLADGSDVDERLARAQADLRFPSPGSEVVHIPRIEHAVLAAGGVQQDSIRCHGDFLARLGHQAHGLAADRMSWLGGAWTGTGASEPL